MTKKIIVFGGTFNPIHQAHLRIARFLLRKFRPDKILFIPCNIPYHKTCEEVIASRHRMEMVRRAISNEPRFTISDIEIKRGGKTFSVETMKALKRQYPAGTRFYFVIGTDSLVDLPRWYEIDKLIKLCKFITIARPGYPFNKLVQKLPLAPLERTIIRDKDISCSLKHNAELSNGLRSYPTLFHSYGVRRCRFGTPQPFRSQAKEEVATDSPENLLLLSAGILKSIKQLYQPRLRLDISSTLIRKNIREHKSIKSLVPAVVANYIKEHKLYRLRT